MATPGDVVEELIWKITVQTQGAAEQINNLQGQVEAMKAEFRRLATESGQDFKTVAASMRLAWGEEFNNRIRAIREQIREAAADIRKFNAELKETRGGATLDKTKEASILGNLDKATADLRKYREELAQIQQQSKTTSAVATRALSELNKETRDSAKAAKESQTSFEGLNTVSRVFFGTTLAGLALGVINGIKRGLSEAAEAGRSFSQSIFQLEVGVRALRRVGIDVTTAEILENLQNINQETGNLFTNLELIKGAASFVNLIRDLGLTREQIFSLQQTVLQLAIINGRAMDDVQRTVALALSSGYTEGLQRLGVSINRLTIAEEANRIGFEGGYIALSENARALATYNILTQKAAIYADDLSEAQTRLFGAIQGTEVQIQNTQAAIGEQLLPVQLLWNKALLGFIKILQNIPFVAAIRSITSIYQIVRALPAVWEEAGKGTANFAESASIVSEFFSNLLEQLSGTAFVKKAVETFNKVRDAVVLSFGKIGDVFGSILDPIIRPISEFINVVRTNVTQTFNRLNREVSNSELGKFFKTVLKDADEFIRKLLVIFDFISAIGKANKDNEPLATVISDFAGFGQDELALGEKLFSQSQEKLVDIMEKYGKELVDLQEEIADKRKKIEEDLQKDLQKIANKGVQDRLKIEQDYANDLDKLQRQAARRTADLGLELQRRLSAIDLKLDFNLNEAKIKFDFDVSETVIKFNQDVAKANDEFRQKEIDRERQFTEELLRIREDYLLDLEDALENRDARAVLRARRQFILDRERAARENELNKQKNQEGLQEDLVAAQQRRDARIRELQFELQQRQETLRRQAEFDRAEAQRRYNEDLEDLKRKLQAEEYERFIAYLEQKRDQADREKKARDDRLLEHANELTELQEFEDEKLRIIGEALAEQARLLNLTNEEVLEAIKTYFGDNGLALNIYRSFLKSVEELIKAFERSFSGVDVDKFNLDFTERKKPVGFAQGGAVVANKPTTVTFGEVPEVAIFSPLSEIDQLPSLLGGLVGSPGGNSQVLVRVGLDQGLVAEIVDQSSEAVAEVVFERNRSRQRL